MSPRTAEQRELADEVAEFLSHERPPPPFTNVDDRFRHLAAYQRRLNDAGLAVPGWPRAFGGRGLGPADAAVVSRALGLGGAPELINFVGTDVVGPALFRFGRRERLLSWMPRMAAADEIWCQLFSEPDAGSDLTSLRTKAREIDGGFVIDGQKVWSTWAQYADWGVLLARTGTTESRHRGITAFVIRMSTPGITVRPLATMTGSAEFAEVYFDGVRVPSDAALGDLNGGWTVAQVILNAERGPYAVRRAAVIGASLQRVLGTARVRALDPTTRGKVARAVTSLRLLELRIDRLVDELASGVDIGAEAALIKQLMTDAEQTIADLALRLEGTHALAWEDGACTAVVEDYLYSRAASIYGGTAEIQRNIIGERLLGLPREPAR